MVMHLIIITIIIIINLYQRPVYERFWLQFNAFLGPCLQHDHHLYYGHNIVVRWP